MNTLKLAERWWHGQIEVIGFVVFGSSYDEFASLKQYFQGPRGDFKNCSWGVNCTPVWKTVSRKILIWDKDKFGDVMKYKWYEEDADGDPIEVSVGFTTKMTDNTSITGSVKITITDEDYDLGEAFVNYSHNTDGSGYTYETGRFLFTVKQ